MISLLKILNELEINNPSKPTNNKQLLDFLNKNKEKVTKYIIDTYYSFDNDDEDLIEDLKNSHFEIDGSDNPSIGDGYTYFSFSLNEEELSTENDNAEVEILDLFSFPIYFIQYSI